MTAKLTYQGGKYTLFDIEAQRHIITSDKLEELINATSEGDILAITIDVEEFFIRKALLPKIGKEKVQEILPIEMEGRFIVPAKELFFELVLLNEEDNGDLYLVLGLKRQFLTDLLMPFLNRGVKISSVSIEKADLLSELVGEEHIEKLKEINFFPKELSSYTEKKRAFGVIKRAVIYAVTAILITIIGFGIRLYFLSKKEAELRREINAQFSALFTESKASNLSPTIVQAKLQVLKQSYRAFKGVEILDLLKDLSQPSNACTVKEINVDKGKLIIKGEGKDFAGIELYKNALKKQIPTVNIAETKNLSNGLMLFVLEATIVK